ncbi:MAG TPA: phosphoglycerate dehydrogenase [Actinomycetota bacterium]|nr:phosphoglycerate dehydrogenase [Actinomycetota bacterium]
MPLKVLVAEPLAEEGIEKMRAELDVDVLPELPRQEFLDVIGEYEAVIVRSATQIDKEAIDKGWRLKVVGRAGIGLDNIDVEAATRRGILVVNAPQSNILSAAEHSMALLLSMARQVPAADASLRAGNWARSKFNGVELHGKTLGVVGLGRIGTLVAQRAAGFGMRLVVFDPYVTEARASELKATLATSLDDLLGQADFITIHLPKTSETKGILGAEQFAKMKPGVRIVNAARGGIVDEAALLQAHKDGIVAGAAIDVYEKEPAPADHPFFKEPDFVVTPHLGASTAEAQEKAGTAIAEQVLLALRGEFAPYAVNIKGGAEYVEAIRPFISLTEKLGRIAHAVAGDRITEVHMEFRGTVAEHDTRILTLAGLKGLFSAIVHEPVTYVNAPLLAAERGIQTKETKSALASDYVSLVSIAVGSEKDSVRVAGTLVGKKDEERIVEVWGYGMDMLPERNMCFIKYTDRPGVVGRVGSVLGEAGVNIASMQVSRQTIGGEALMGLTVDDEIPSEVLGKIKESIDATDVRAIDLGA